MDSAAFDDLFSPSFESGLEGLLGSSDAIKDVDLEDLELSDLDFSELLGPEQALQHPPVQQEEAPTSSSGEQEYPTSSTAEWARLSSGQARTSQFQCTGEHCEVAVERCSLPQAAPTSSCSADTSAIAGQHQADSSSKAEQLTDEEAKKKARMQRNRESAHLSRERKRMQTEEVESKCRDLHTHNVQLIGLVNHLTRENGMLRHHLALLSQQAGLPCPILGPPPVGALPGQPIAMGLPPPGMPGVCVAPLKLPIQKLKNSRAPVQPKAQPAAYGAAAQPTPAPQPKPAAAPASNAALPTGDASLSMPASNSSGRLPTQGRAKRMRKGAAVACASMLVVCTFMLLSGPSSPTMPALLQQPMPLAAASTSGSVAVVPARNVAPQARRSSVGRMLASVPQETLPGNATSGLEPDWRDALLTGRYNESMRLVLRPNDLGTEKKALTRLKEMAPLAVFDQWDERWSGSWQSYGQMARAVFGGDGFISPAHCKEVFSFDASQLPRPELVRDRLQYYAAMQTVGRSSAKEAALPLPPASDELHRTAPVVHGFHAGEELASYPKRTVGKGEPWETEVVSIILPTKAPKNDSDSLTSLDSLLVVVLTPNTRYTTYSCALPYPIFV